MEIILVRSDAGTVIQLKVYSSKSLSINAQGLALAVTSDGNINQLGDGDDGDLSVQDDAENRISSGSVINEGVNLYLEEVYDS